MLLSLNKMHRKFLHIFPWVYRPLLFISKLYSTAWTYSLFMHSTTEGYGASQLAQWLKNPPAMRETQEMPVQSLGEEGPLEKGMATHSSILAWKISWTEEPGGLQSIGSQRVRHDWNDLACMHVLKDYCLAALTLALTSSSDSFFGGVWSRGGRTFPLSSQRKHICKENEPPKEIPLAWYFFF